MTLRTRGMAYGVGINDLVNIIDGVIDVNAIGESPEELRQQLQAHLKLLESYAGGNRDV